MIYLSLNWSGIPETVALHYNAYGEADRFGSRDTLWWMLILVPSLTYLLLLLLEKYGPRLMVNSLGGKLYVVRFILSSTIAAIFLLWIDSLANDSSDFHSNLLVLLGLLFVFLGNYLRSVKPNYFIGFRTPWTLRNEEVWRITHQKGSVVWFVGGLLIAGLNLFSKDPRLLVVSYSVLVLLVIIPILISYTHFRTLTNKPL